ncbi:hypothetical protein [Nocardia sp. NPDC057030]|uniref:phage upper tail fiber protein n=1 Tax=unclassified Nocardia TaxID=2637762 RepID=UPI003626C520
MTTIAETLRNIAGVDETEPLTFFIDELRENADGTGTVTTRVHQVWPVDGRVVTEDLDPGPARVRIGLVTYPIVIPDSQSAVRLWPLLDASIPPPPQTNQFVRNGGGIARAQRITASAYAALVTPDPQTLYFVVAD